MDVLDKFGKFIIENLRDKALKQNYMLLNGELRGKNIQLLQSMVVSLGDEGKNILKAVALDLIDTAIHDFLFAIQDAHDRELGIEVFVDGKNIAEMSGMLHGEPLGEHGWIDRFSRFERDKLK